MNAAANLSDTKIEEQLIILQNGGESMNLGTLVGKTALIISSAHSSRYGYVGRTVTAGTVLSAEDTIRVLMEEGRFKGKTWEVPMCKASIENPTAELCALRSEGVWVSDDTPSTATPDIVILWEQWQPE